MPGKRWRRIFDDEGAKTSFALVGIFILIIGSINIVYLVAINDDFRGGYFENKEISQMTVLTDKAHIEVQSAAFFIAKEAIGPGTQERNLETIEKNFMREFTNYLERDMNFPRRMGKYKISILSHEETIGTNENGMYEITGFVTYMIDNRETKRNMERTLLIDRTIDPSNLKY